MSASKILSKNKQLIFVNTRLALNLTKYASTNKRNNSNIIFSNNSKKNQYNKSILLSNSNISKRFQSTENSGKSGESTKNEFFSNFLKYLISIGFGGTVGLVTGYFLMRDQFKNENQNEETRYVDYQATKYIEHKDSPYTSFPLTFHLYQYASCPYCAQIRAYLDYFGFNYHLTEVDSYSKEELLKFTRARQLPILVIEENKFGKNGRSRFHLTNATAILSCLESLRNEKHVNFDRVISQYLPVLKGHTLHSTSNPFKYHVGYSDLNSVEWRRWINNSAIPAFKLNSIANLKDLFETFDYYAKKSNWHERYNNFKYLYVYYTNAFKTYLNYSTLLEQLSPYDKNKSPRKILHEVISKWEEGLADNKFMSGGDKPNLADLCMFGNVKAFEGCALYREAIAKHPKFKDWYERTKSEIINGFEHKNKSNTKFLNFFLPSFEEENKKQQSIIETNQPDPSVAHNNSINKVSKVKKSDKKVERQTQTEQMPNEKKEVADKPTNNELTTFRVLTVTYIVHMIAFTFAAWSK